MTEKREVFWSLGGLPFGELLRRTLRESWHDEVFGQAGRMAFYHFLAIFPSLLVFLAISARVPHMSGGMRNALHDVADQVLPGPVAQLFRSMVEELGQHARSHAHLLPVLAGACWAALNGTWAMVYGLNNAYEVEERRSWHRLGATIVSLTVTLAMSASLAIFLIFCGRRLQGHVGVGDIALRSVEWIILTIFLSFSFSLLYRFAPNLEKHAWRWSTPGALCALLLWIGATLLARIYFDHVNDYARSYGHLNGVVMLLLWLYLTNGAILIGGEMNSEIEKAIAEPQRTDNSRAHRHSEGRPRTS